MASDVHRGLREVIAANPPGAARQRCRTHDIADLSAVRPTGMRSAVDAVLHSVYHHVKDTRPYRRRDPALAESPQTGKGVTTTSGLVRK